MCREVGRARDRDRHAEAGTKGMLERPADERPAAQWGEQFVAARRAVEDEPGRAAGAEHDGPDAVLPFGGPELPVG